MAGPMPHKYVDSHDHEKAFSYAVVTKHESKHSDDQGHHDIHHKEHHVHHDMYHGHHEHHDKYHGHHGHMEIHGAAHQHHHDEHHDHHGHVKYEFKYGVKDPKTGDIKDQWESRDGDKVKGSYSLKEADGTTRVVKYSSDKKTGFEATVHKIGQAHHGHMDHKEHGHHDHHKTKHENIVVKHEHNVKHEHHEKKHSHHDKHEHHGHHEQYSHGHDHGHGHGHASSFIVVKKH